MVLSASSNQALAQKGYEVVRSVSSGAFGAVVQARRVTDGTPVAIKIVPVNTMSMECHATRLLIKEIEVLSAIQHPNIMEFIESFTENGVLGGDRHGDVVFIVTEFLDGGDLFDRISDQLLTEGQAINLAKQLLSALTYLKSHGICHRDLKLENVCLIKGKDGSTTAKLIDFGYATFLNGESTLSGAQTVGTLNYTPPQIVQRTEYNPHKLDAWSLGVVLYAATCGRFPFYGLKREDIETMIQNSEPNFSEPEWGNCSFAFKSLLRQLMSKDESYRPDLEIALLEVERIQKSSATIQRKQMSARTLLAGKTRRTWYHKDGRSTAVYDRAGITI